MLRCPSCTQLSEEGSRFCGYCGTLLSSPDASPVASPARPAAADVGAAPGPHPADRPQLAFAPRLPSRTATIVVTIFFGLFGAIPASLHTSRAARMGAPTKRYWKAFWWSLIGSTGAVVASLTVFFVVVLGTLGHSTSRTPQAWTPRMLGSTAPAQNLPGGKVSDNGVGDTNDSGASTDTENDTSQTTPPVITIPSGGQVCASGSNSVGFDGSASGNDHTSCQFSQAVRDAYAASGGDGTDAQVRAFSSVTKKWYTMSCTGSAPVECTGGNDALVLIYSSDATVQPE